MSTSVFYKPIGMTLSTRTHEAMLIYRPEIRKVKRVLFEPVDHVATQKFIEEELEKITVMESEKWNFDFKREKTLNPDGVYKWRPATPQKHARPAVRETRLAEEAVEDLYGDPGEIARAAPADEEEMKSPPKTVQNRKPQRLITDFMTVKKRSTPEFSKKSDWTPSMERPSKLARLTDSS